MHLDARLLCVLKEHQIKIRALDLPGICCRVIQMLKEVKGLGFLTFGRHKLDAILPRKRDALHLLEHP